MTDWEEMIENAYRIELDEGDKMLFVFDDDVATDEMSSAVAELTDFLGSRDRFALTNSLEKLYKVKDIR